MLTILGKILVLVNLTISYMLMIWAINLYGSRIDWSDFKEFKVTDETMKILRDPKTEVPPGEVQQIESTLKNKEFKRREVLAAKLDEMPLSARTKALVLRWAVKEGVDEGELDRRLERAAAAWTPLPRVESDWRTARQNLLALEARRRDTRRWYEAELALLEKDPNPKAPTALNEITTDLAGQLEIDLAPDPNPNAEYKNPIRLKMKPVVDRTPKKNPLNARNVYDYQAKDLFGTEMKDGLTQHRTSLREALEKNVETLARMLGPKGLHARLLEERLKRDALIGEYRAVEPLLINTASSSQFAVEREYELKTRLEELQVKRDELLRKLGRVDAKAP